MDPLEAFPLTYLFDHFILFFLIGIQAFHHGFLESKEKWASQLRTPGPASYEKIVIFSLNVV